MIDDVYLIRKDKQYLYYVDDYGGNVNIRWTVYRWDAWSTSRIGMACLVADRVHGAVVKFNVVTGKTANCRRH